MNPGKKSKRLSNLVASGNWCIRIISQYNLNSRVLHGQAGRADAEIAKEEMPDLRARPTEYSDHEIHIVDKIALFYKSIPERTYVL